MSYGYIIPTTKLQKYVAKSKRHQKYRLKYARCKAKMEKKGKKAYPHSDGRSRCKGYYKKMQKYELKKSEKAATLRGRLERRGKLSPELDTELKVASGEIRTATGTSSVTKPGEFQPSTAEDMQMAAMAMTAPEDFDTDEDFADEDEGGIPTWAIAAGGLAVLGAGAWLLMGRR
jgi:hypothetical protein